MTDKDFENLKREIEAKTQELNDLQSKYRKETGRNYVVPLYLLSNAKVRKELGYKGRSFPLIRSCRITRLLLPGEKLKNNS